MSEEAAKYETKKKKETKKVLRGLVLTNFKIDGKLYRKGVEYSTTDNERFKKLIRINKINKK